MQERIVGLIKESTKAKEFLLTSQSGKIESAARAILASLKIGGKVLIFGNGGSAADSQHFAAELVGRFKKERAPLPAIALTVNTSALTAIANDYGYDVVFARQIEALGKKGDIAVGLSTSGNSKNVIEAFRKARKLGIVTIGLLGKDGGYLKDECDIAIVVRSDDTPRIQEAHITIIHILCEIIDG
jgi:D-sedoheptulose 7-phosphate isomerase